MRSQGFGLIESVLALVIFSLIAAFCFPLASDFYQKNLLDGRASELRAALRFAQNTALTRGDNLILSPLPGTNDWSAGMILFIDKGNHQYSPGDLLLREWQWCSNSLRLSWKGFYSDNYLLFSADMKQAILSGHFDIQAVNRSAIRLIVNRLGRVQQMGSNWDENLLLLRGNR